ncbi:MAG: type I methionyl aminopeptidase [Deltaproteobacteria bacterium]|nr:type I methionyl aminopeptidase [Deltaproteobacteria bacterium]
MLASKAQIRLKSARDLEALRRSCRLAAETLLLAGDRLRVGMTTLEIDELVHGFIVDHGAYPSPLNYHGFPKSVCTSVNEVVCHGIPSRRRLRDGDIINIDVTCKLDGFHGDTSATFFVGTPSAEARHLVEVTRRCLEIGIEQVRPGRRIGEIGRVIEAYAVAQGCSVVRDFVGHGIGRDFHEGPQVPHFGDAGRGARMEPGMTFTIEPMINLGTWELEILEDGWTAVTKDRRLSAQFEHTLAVTETGCEVLTARSRPLRHSEPTDEPPARPATDPVSG